MEIKTNKELKNCKFVWDNILNCEKILDDNEANLILKYSKKFRKKMIL